LSVISITHRGFSLIQNIYCMGICMGISYDHILLTNYAKILKAMSKKIMIDERGETTT